MKWDIFLLLYCESKHYINQTREVIHIPTRDEIYSNEAAGILSEIAMYPGILEKQVYAFHPGKESQIQNLITYFIKQDRIHRDEKGSLYLTGYTKKKPKKIIIRSLWVLLDFLSDVEYHCAGEYPVTIVFLIKGKEYQLLYAAEGNEAMIAAVVNHQKDNTARRIILVESADQIYRLDMPGIVGYCTVDFDGNISYYKSHS